MNREQKTQFVEEIREQFDAAILVALTDFKGSTVAQMDGLRRACEQVPGVEYRVVKNTLCIRALEGTDKQGLSEHFRGNVGVFFASDDPIVAAKLLRDQLKENDKLVVKAGFFEGDVLDEVGIKKVADLPSREELLSTLLRTIQEGPRQVMGVIQGPARDLVYVLSNYAAKLEEGDEAA